MIHIENITYDEETKLFNVPEVNYNLDKKYLKNWNIEFYKKADIPFGLLGFATFRIDNYLYLFGGFSAGKNSINGLSFYANELVGKHEAKYYNNLLRYDLDKDSWINLGSIDEIYPRGLMLHCTYKNKMYIFGGISNKFMSLEYLNLYKKKYGKWPEKKGLTYFDDCFEIEVDKDNKIICKKIMTLPFTYNSPPVTNSSIVYQNRLYFIGGETGKCQNMSLPDKFKKYIKNKTNLDISDNNSGNLLFYINLDDFSEGVMVKSKFPGVSIVYSNLTIHNNLLYIFSSVHFNNSKKTNFRPGEKNKVACSDNWKYNFETDEWIKIRNSPMEGVSCRKSFKLNNRYILFFGSIRLFYSVTKDSDVKTVEFPLKDDEFNPKFKYGTISNQYSKYNETSYNDVISYNKIKAYDYYQHYFSDFILIYDIIDDKYFTMNKKMPVNLLSSSVVKYKDELFFIGGEMNDILINNKFHGIQSNLSFSAKISGFESE